MKPLVPDLLKILYRFCYCYNSLILIIKNNFKNSFPLFYQLMKTIITIGRGSGYYLIFTIYKNSIRYPVLRYFEIQNSIPNIVKVLVLLSHQYLVTTAMTILRIRLYLEILKYNLYLQPKIVLQRQILPNSCEKDKSKSARRNCRIQCVRSS